MRLSTAVVIVSHYMNMTVDEFPTMKKSYVFFIVSIALLLIYGLSLLRYRPTATTESTAAAGLHLKAASTLKLEGGTHRPAEQLIWPAVQKNCSLLEAGDAVEVAKVKRQLTAWNESEAQENFDALMSGDCVDISKQLSHNFYVSKEELDFPIAFTMLVHSDAVQVFRLLKAIYRQHNSYCIHPDAKSTARYVSYFRKLEECVDNIFVASKFYEVFWGYHTLLDGELVCMEDLLNADNHWKYIINIGGQELPLKTNREIVKALRAMNGNSVIHSSPISPQVRQKRLTHKVSFNNKTKKVYKSKVKLSPAPHNITLLKGSHFCALTRDFLKFLLFNEHMQDFRNYLSDGRIPEEEFFASAYKHSEAPTGQTLDNNVKIPWVSESIWMSSRQKCKSNVFIHAICILSVEEMPYVVEVDESLPEIFFLNKYRMDRDHVVMDCIEERLMKKNELEFRQDQIVQPVTV